MVAKPHNYQTHIVHEPSENRPDGVDMTMSFKNADTANGWVYRAASAGASMAQVIRKSDGKVITDPINGIETDYREW